MLREVAKALLKGEAVDWLASRVGRRSGAVARDYRRVFYPGLALIMGVAVLVNVFLESVQDEVKSQSLDMAVRHRLASPPADPAVIILDIDERSLALMAGEHGRWPWPRSVVAEMIANLRDLGVTSIAVNVMMSDPDKGNPDADAIFNEVAAGAANTVFPLIRLNPANDAQSQVKASALPGVRLASPEAGERTIAVLFPFAPGTHDKLGLANLKPDMDGVVRRYAANWHEGGVVLPSIALRAVQLAGKEPVLGAKAQRDGILLNWRNKGTGYRRIPFADVYQAMNGKGDLDLKVLRGAIVVLGVSAPGIATVKGTPVSPVMDDNIIIATAIDDLRNDTHLRLLPPWASGLVSLGILGLIALAFARGVSDKLINRAFVVGQGSLALITIGSASFTHYLVDLSSCFVVGLFYFLVASVYLRIDRNATRGMPSFADIHMGPGSRHCILLGTGRKAPRKILDQLRARLEQRYGLRQTFVIDNAFGDGHLFGRACKDMRFLLAFTSENSARDAEQAAADCGLPCTVEVQALPADHTQREQIEKLIGGRLLSMGARLLAGGT